MHGSREPGGVHLAHGVDMLPVIGDLLLGQIEADGPAVLAEFNGQREADVSEADDGNDGFIHDLPTYCA